MNALDQVVVTWLQTLGAFWPGLVVVLGSYLPWLLIVLALVFIATQVHTSKRWEAAVLVGGATFLSWFAATVLKNIIMRPRPFLTLVGTQPLINVAEQFSMPSSHAAAFTALALALYRHNKILGGCYVVAVVLIGVARVAAGVHWLSDILAGILLGAAVEAVLAGLARFRLYYGSK